SRDSSWRQEPPAPNRRGCQPGRWAPGEGHPPELGQGAERLGNSRKGEVRRGRDYTISRTASEARSSVSSISESSCAVERKPASKAEGARNTPRRRHPWKNARKR